MAFTRKWLTAMGIEQDKVDEIINAHIEVVDALKGERDQFKADADSLPELQKQLEKLKIASAMEGENPYKDKYDEKVKEFDDYKKEVEAKETKRAKEAAYRDMLKEAGVSDKRLDSILKVTDLEGIKLDKDGKIDGADAVLESAKKEWADFIVTTTEQGAQTANPPQSNGGNTMTKAEILAIKDGNERRQAIADNADLFGLPQKGE